MLYALGLLLILFSIPILIGLAGYLLLGVFLYFDLIRIYIVDFHYYKYDLLVHLSIPLLSIIVFIVIAKVLGWFMKSKNKDGGSP